MVAVETLLEYRIGISAVISEILKFFGHYDDIRIRGHRKRSQN